MPTSNASMNARPNTFFLSLSLVFPLLTAGAATDPFAENIRTTEPLTPEQQQKTFQLPPGFEIQLVAAEPEIGKPMNMAFDERGRLWLTQSREYPFPGPTNAPGRDQIKILADFGPDGRARKVTTFAQGLNLPIGLLPYKDGALAFSLPNIYYLADTNADGVVDTKEKVLGTFGFDRDTHGLTSSFRRGYDGWVYADHGFNNNSTLTAADGSTITMNSGNTYRFRPDGSRVEQFTWGQVNPFGLMFDPLGDLWASDCHSLPVYQLLRGAYYPSFGKPHDGLGFAPVICDHLHNSTAIAGMVYYAATNFPPEYHGNTFIGNVMTCRINRDSYEEQGSTRIAKEEPDFLRTTDPWFRPVDVQLGPDGALYVADFYNRIIGHYEVPLDHPGRDRERGRIWRIVYRGDVAKAPAPVPVTESLKDTAALIQDLTHPNVNVRMFAMNALVDRIGPAAVTPVQALLRSPQASAEQQAHGLWVLHRLNALTPDALAAAASSPAKLVRVHAMRVFAEKPDWTAAQRALVVAALRDADPYVQRAAAEALGCQPHPEHVLPLLAFRQSIAAPDKQLLHVTRIALRNQLRVEGAFSALDLAKLSEADSRALTDVALGVPTTAAGSLVLNHARNFPLSRDALVNYLRHAARYAPVDGLGGMAELVQERFAKDPDTQFVLFKSVQEGLAQRGQQLTPELRAWAAELATALLANGGEARTPWVSVPLREETESPWILQKRSSADGNTEATFFSSLPPNGESLTGMLRSEVFTVPPKLSFYIAGHDGPPDRAPKKKNYIRLRMARGSEEFMRAAPPRNDTAQLVTWDLSAFAGRQGALEIVDGDTGDAYAWLAVGRFDPPVVPMPLTNPNQRNQRPLNAAELARTVPLPELAPRFAELFEQPRGRTEFRASAAEVLVALKGAESVPTIARVLANTNQSPNLRESLALLLAGQNLPEARAAVLHALPAAAQRLQVKLALALAGNPMGAEALMSEVLAGKLPPQIIMDRAVKERLTAARLPDFDDRYAKLTHGVTPVSVELQKLIEARRVGYGQATTVAERGRAVFEKSCAVCHQLDGKGAVVGPQLDGVGNRGLERIVEDVLDPSRNIDPAFRPTLVTLKDDTAITGLQRREAGEVIVFVDTQGKEVVVPKKDIVERRESQLSLMPSNFGEVLPAGEFYDLMAFLLAHGSK